MIMRKIVIAALSALCLAGCASTDAPVAYGNYLPLASGDQQQLAGDAVKQLALLYPPAKTCFELQHATPDAFGLALIKNLRERGYALVEFNPKTARADSSAGEATAGAARPPLPLRYVVDQAGTSNLYRLTLLVGNQFIARPYLIDNGSFVPAGYWARKE
jgi:hypothetical protein